MRLATYDLMRRKSMSNTQPIKIGYIKTFAEKGDRITVYFADGSTGSFTAQNDLISSEVVVMGDRVFSEDVSRSLLSRTTELFKSQQLDIGEVSYPWAYLFSIDDYEAMQDSEGREIQYTDSSWSLDDLEGHLKSFGDGGGEYKTFEELDEFMQGYLYPEKVGYEMSNLQVHINIINLFSRFPQYVGVNPALTITPFANFDGVDAKSMYVVFSVNERRRTRQNVNRPIYADRQYWIKEKLIVEYYWVVYRILENPSEPTSNRYNVGISYYNTGEIRSKAANYYNSSLTTLARYAVDTNGNISESYRKNGRTPNPTWTQTKRTQLQNILNSVVGAIVAPNFSSLGNEFNNRIISGQTLIDEQVSREFDTGVFPEAIATTIGEMLFYRTESSSGQIYVAKVFLIPIKVDRNPGVKNIYAQVGNNRKTLLHTIPSFETWDGYLSPIEDNKIEVVLRCAKKFPKDRSLSNWRIKTGRSPGKNKYDREWSQTRVIHLSKSSGAVVNEQIYNNSKTDLNPSSVADTIEINPSNWQKPWLETYDDWRTESTFRVVEVSQSEYNYIDDELIYSRSGESRDLITGFRTYLSELLTDQIKGVINTKIARFLIKSSGYGTITKTKFVYVNPNDLLDKNITLDRSFTWTSIAFPSPNYTVFSGLANKSTIREVYYTCTPTYMANTFNSGVSTERATKFPKLDLSEEYAAGIKIPKQITSSDWNTEWSTDPEINTNLLRFGFKAIAFLG